MRYWLIGCGTVLAVLVALVVFGGVYLYKRYEGMEDRMQGVNASYRRLADAYPFRKPEGSLIPPERMGGYAACRAALASAVDAWEAQIEDEERSGLKKFTLLYFDMFPSLAERHARALGEAEMSPAEYLWLTNMTLLALRWAEVPEAPGELKELREAFDRLLEEEGDDLEPAEEGPKGMEGPAGIIDMLLPAVDGEMIRMPPENVAVIVEHRAALLESMRLFLFFDPGFRSLFHDLFKE